MLWLFVVAAQWVATACCVLGAMLLQPISWVEENVVGGNKERKVREAVLGDG